MTLNEYQTLAARTIATDDVDQMERHALHGLTAEIGELMDSCFGTDLEHTIKECGDVCWMVAELCTTHEWFLGDIVQDLDGCWGMSCAAYAAIDNGLLNGTYQKVLQGHRWDVETAKRALGNIFRNVMGVAGCCGSSPDHVLQTNIEKLKARYPDGFSTDRSLHRADGDV